MCYVNLMNGPGDLFEKSLFIERMTPERDAGKLALNLANPIGICCGYALCHIFRLSLRV